MILGVMIIPAIVTLLALYSLVAVMICIELNSDDHFHFWCPLCLLCRAALIVTRWRRL